MSDTTTSPDGAKPGRSTAARDRAAAAAPRGRSRRSPASTSRSGPEHQRRRPPAAVRPSETGPDTTATLAPLAQATSQDWLGTNSDPDVLLSVPNLGIDRISLKVKNVDAHVELHAKVLDLLELHVGADVGIEEVDLKVDNIRVQAMLKVKLERVVELVGDVVQLLDDHPEIVTSLTAGLGRGLEHALSPSDDHLEWSTHTLPRRDA